MIHDHSARRAPARKTTLPMLAAATTQPTAATTQPDDLLPACCVALDADEPLLPTRLDGIRYQSFVRRLSEEVVLHSGDLRVDDDERTG